MSRKSVLEKEEHVECRAYGHAWDREVDRSLLPDNVKVLRGFIDAVRCVRCNTVRVDQMDMSGHVQSREYLYQDENYSNVTHLVRADARVWLYKNDRKKASAERIAFTGRPPSHRARRRRQSVAV